jgi:hypothetical protein
MSVKLGIEVLEPGVISLASIAGSARGKTAP